MNRTLHRQYLPWWKNREWVNQADDDQVLNALWLRKATRRSCAFPTSPETAFN